MAQSFNINWKTLNEELLARGIVVPGLNLPQFQSRHENSLVRHAVDVPAGTSLTSTTQDRPMVDGIDMVDFLDVDDEELDQGPNCDKEKTLNNDQ